MSSDFAVVGVNPSPAKKPRGRPPGSKNKPKPPLVITRDSESSMRPAVLEVASGTDVVEAVAGFARRRRLSVSVLSGSGAVSNVTLRHPTSAASVLALHGRFDILSLSGTLFPPSAASAAVNSPPLAISLAGVQGQVIGGTIAGSLTAAGPVVLIVASFQNPTFHRLSSAADEAEEGEDVKQEAEGEGKKGERRGYSSAGDGGSSASGAAARNSLFGHFSPDVLAWAPPQLRPPHHPF
ncbi:putative DNA-binding protein ESCAROLA [Acorus calamus]|uniref:AT-hook motif nuclear-localized protein n=1 Tax=Acorus calamus TaxID=4465 RepID=A0AAV9EV52_ACOCL|nr:putative DNA-binding protein ESCAROLA [Acorus calamus]